jgi:hypothetical protein
MLLVMGCSSAYRQLQPATNDTSLLQKFRPVFSTALYRTSVDVMGRHLSGLLLIKRMPDSSLRMVFSNEVGFKFFDFEFSKDGAFRVFSIIRQMNKKAVINTLRKDFELLLMERLDMGRAITRTGDGLVYYSFPKDKGYDHYITDTTGTRLVRMERSSKRKPVMDAIMRNYIGGMPDTIGITHRNFNFTIALKRIER